MTADWLAAIRFVAITDRTRMVDREVLAANDWTAIAGEFGEAIARVVEARSDVLVQVREKDLDGRPLLALVRAALATGARVLVNDRLDVALAANAHGVHLPERGLPIETARALAPDFVIGVSCHTIEGVQSAIAAGADVIHLGPIWETPHKGTPLGPSALTRARAQIARSQTGARLVAVGGIDAPARRDEAWHAGADAVAAIRALWSTHSARRTDRHLHPELLSGS